ncbi:two-component system OmpR family response regulator [Endozoicomonas sp. NE40]|uniref:Two-component system OmpR family response regulator n=2 Tax=Endozoicomonas lisbonensis TaxID=3120522 RepID=A0ABV2SDZ9_9GAMM
MLQYIGIWLLMVDSSTVFVVDDDDSIRDLLASYLKKNGYNVIAANSGESFLQEFQEWRSAGEDESRVIVVLDIMMPGMDGFDVCRELRTFSKAPVIMLTAVSDEMDRIIGLEMGADDYLGKPFNPRELLARIKAIFRRSEQVAEPKTTGRYAVFNGFCLDKVTRELTSPEGEPVPLTGADYNLLMLFIRNQGKVLSRESIAEVTRKRNSAPMDRFIDVNVSRLRQCLGENARAPELIKTVRGQGYILTTEVEWVDKVPA